MLTQARAMVVREYLVENFGFDDSNLKTLGLGKQTGANTDAEGGSIQILIFPPGTEIPSVGKSANSVPSGIASGLPAHISADSTQKP
jgi:hypothetical protein